jgi:urocanate hydratase
VSLNSIIGEAMTIKLDDHLPPELFFEPSIRRAPKRELNLNRAEIELALKNALRYIPDELHERLAPEFLQELLTRGRIYGYRYRPQGRIKGRPIEEYRGNCIEGKAFQVMIDNNLDFDVALYPYELVTYGETASLPELDAIQTYKEIPGGADRRADACGHVGSPSWSLQVSPVQPKGHYHQCPYGRDF